MCDPAREKHLDVESVLDELEAEFDRIAFERARVLSAAAHTPPAWRQRLVRYRNRRARRR